MKTKVWYFAFSALCALAVAVGFLSFSSYTSRNESSEDLIVKAEDVPVEEQYPFVISPNSSLFVSLRQINIEPQIINQIVTSAKPIFDLGRLMPGTRYQVIYDNNDLKNVMGIKFRFSPMELLEIIKTGDSWTANKIIEPIHIKVVTFSGTVKSSLWESALEANMDPNLIADLADIFAWQVDFAREVRVNDRWRLSVEQKFVRNEAVGWGSILAAEYENAGDVFTASLFRHEGKSIGYFAPDGSSLRRMFLKSPLQYRRISSRFQMRRFHPILKVRRPHLGVDYSAPTGTPVRAVGSGTITLAGKRGGAGNMIQIRHNSVYKTAYKHLSRFGKGIRVGAKVEQGQVIGYVGSTGLSTAPHLHFEFFKHGKYVDPLGQKFPTADPVPQNLMTAFLDASSKNLQTLPQWKEEQAAVRELAAGEHTN